METLEDGSKVFRSKRAEERLADAWEDRRGRQMEELHQQVEREYEQELNRTGKEAFILD